MFLEKLQLTNFRNYENEYFEFSEGLNCIVGKNGSGKTNLIDAIYMLALTKSSIHNQDVHSVRFECEYFLIEGVFKKTNTELISFGYQKNGKKSFLIDKIPYDKISDHIGKFPIVLIAPDDNDLIRDGGETRRKLFDGIISQLNPEYLRAFQGYNRNLDQRNSLLRQFAEHQYFDNDLLEIYTEKLLEFGKIIHNVRKDFLVSFQILFQKHYNALSASNETVEIVYNSDVFQANFDDIFRNNIPHDLAAQRTTKGIHKDEYVFRMDESLVKKFGSQGQKKSFIMAIRLAQFEIITNAKSLKPILLLDDIFDKLDESRIKKLTEMINNGVFGQIFLTDARPNRTKDLMKKLNVAVKFIEIDK